MAEKKHHYSLNLVWTGNTGAGTTDYRAYQRDFQITAAGKPVLLGSSDPAFRGDPARYNPEEWLVGALSSCHLLWYLHLCATAGVVVEAYSDQPQGSMVETADGGGHFTQVELFPTVVVQSVNMLERAYELHAQAHHLCFIANSCNFPIAVTPTITAGP